MSIGEFARRSRLSPKALRLYERQGLLVPTAVDPVTGYRSYAEDQLDAARLIGRLRRLDMPLAVVGAVLAAPADARADLVAEYWAAVVRRIAVQSDLAAYLRSMLSEGKGLSAMYEVSSRAVPDQVVLTEQRHIRQPELSGWIGAAMSRLFTTALTDGGPSGSPFVIYHGEVTEDSDGPVEVCVPVAREVAGTPSRVEPAHTEAFVRLRKREVRYPQILGAFDAVATWVTDQGHPLTEAPREVYFADWEKIGPDDPACDIALPFKP
ncbi:MerR family transcriptional regulator [Saccharothrix violaceirubra]